MKKVATLGLAIAVAVLVGSARAEDVKSGPQVGEEVGAFEVVKAAGNETDGVAVGEQLCYRCKLGDRPVVMVFARKPDAALAKLVKELDQTVSKHQDAKMASFVNLLGTDADALKADAKKFIEKSKAEHVAVVVPSDNENGPGAYKINPKAEVTVLIYKEGKVAANHALPSGGLNDKVIKSIIDDTSKILN